MNDTNKYTREDYISDCHNPDMPHIHDKNRFIDFYNELGRDPVQKAQQVIKERIQFIQPKGRMIELGCHVGFNCIYFARLGYDITGVDIATTLIQEAENNLRKETAEVQNRCHFICSDILDLNVTETGQFDTIILTETLEHVIDPLPILAKAKELLRPDGLIYISAPAKRMGTYSHVRGISEEYLTEVCRGLELEIQHMETRKSNTVAIVGHEEQKIRTNYAGIKK